MQLIAGRTAQEYNYRKKRKGAFWEDRYHATAIDTGDYLARCMVYIDLNMVRAGVVTKPDQWRWCGYNVIQTPLKRYRIIDTNTLMKLFEINNYKHFKEVHKSWVESRLKQCGIKREAHWTNCLAIGEENYIIKIKNQLNIDGRYKSIIKDDDTFRLEEPTLSYTYF